MSARTFDMKTKRPYTRAEKALFLAPLLFVLLGVGAWWWKSLLPVSIEVGEVREIAWSPDGRKLLVSTCRNRYVYANAAAVYDTQSGSLETRLSVPIVAMSLENLAWSPDGLQIAAGTTRFLKGPLRLKVKGKIERNQPGEVSIWNAATGAQTRVFSYASPQEWQWPYVEWARDGRLWGVGLPPALFDAATGRRARHFGPPITPPLYQRSQFNPDHTLLWTSNLTNAALYEIPSGKLVRRMKFSDTPSIRWGPGDVLALSLNDPWKPGALRSGKLRIVEARTGRLLNAPPVGYASEMDFAAPGQVAIVDTKWRMQEGAGMIAEASRVVMWDYRARRELWQVVAAPSGFRHWTRLSCSPDKRLVCAVGVGDKHNLVIWEAASGREIWRHGIADPNLSLRWSPDSKRLASWGDGSVKIWHPLLP